MNNEQMSTAQASRHVDDAASTVASCQRALADARQGLATFEAELGDKALAQPDSVDELSRELARLRALVDIGARTLATAERQHAAAEQQYVLAQAGEKRRAAQELRQQAAEIDAECEPLLARLTELQGGVRYTPHRRTGAGSGGTYSDPLPYPEVPRSSVLRSQAEGLEQQAAALERQAKK